MRLNNIIHRPIITEKSMSLRASDNRYTFKVNRKASKGAIANKITSMFNVEVLEVRTAVIPGKKRRRGKSPMFLRTKGWKKAIVTLKEGQKIDLFPEK